MTRRPGDDLFEDSRMSFGEHLEELRKVLVRCLIFIGIGCAVGFLVAEKVVNFLQGPLTRAIKEYTDGDSVKKYNELMGFQPPEIKNRLKEGLAPQTAFVDPGQLVEAIRSISPDALKEIDLTPYRFASRAFKAKHTPAICSAIIKGDTEDSERDSRIQVIKKLIDEPQLAALRDLGGDAAGQKQLLEVLNNLIDKPALHQNDAFAALLTKPVWSWSHLLNPVGDNQLQLMKEQIDKKLGNEATRQDGVVLSRRLNRVLVASVFPDQLAPPTIDLFPVEVWQDIRQGTQALSPHEVFMVWIKAALITGLVLAAPFVFHQLWLFVAAGLYPHEQKYVYYYLPISILLFVLGVCLAFFFVFDPVLKFLFSFNSSMGIAPQLRIGEWLTFVMFLPLGFGIAFQLPLVMLFTNRVGLASIELYKNNWRLAVMIISVLSMLLTPADPISMIMLGGPLTLLYFFGIGLCKWMPKPQNPFGDDATNAVTPV